MENITVTICKHPKLKFGDGTFTGGTDKWEMAGADTLILLDKQYLPDDVLDTGNEISTDQRIIFFPINDMGKPKDRDLEKFSKLIRIIHDDLECGKSVHVQCIGGHGRTGLVLACYVGKYRGIKNPVKWVRQNYCEEAVESWNQIDFISKFTGTRHFISKERYKPFQLVVVKDSKRYDEWWQDLLVQIDEMDKKEIAKE